LLDAGVIIFYGERGALKRGDLIASAWAAGCKYMLSANQNNELVWVLLPRI
jgi:hypothetical protein